MGSLSSIPCFHFLLLSKDVNMRLFVKLDHQKCCRYQLKQLCSFIFDRCCMLFFDNIEKKTAQYCMFKSSVYDVVSSTIL